MDARESGGALAGSRVVQKRYLLLNASVFDASPAAQSLFKDLWPESLRQHNSAEHVR